MILAVDLGDRHVGMALGNPPEIPVHRYTTLDRKLKDALVEIAGIVEKEHVKTVIVGVPISLSGEETEQTYKSLAFLEQLTRKLHPDVEVESVDETLTSVEARRIISVEGGKPEDEHMEAARLMLVQYLHERNT
ncbi:MAG: Holliday junction resolvase RuvX [Candidatus Andersenbacteria bacterium]|nr:Holliday junction resolvase RuvX [Candidatus Andersenbacteria bacterium]MBI3251062.1 Holliday junction resolvase RuvX [Candidatus Andersenbacteria bacterium]